MNVCDLRCRVDFFPMRFAKGQDSVASSSFAVMTQRWTCRLAHFHTHQNAEHVEALLDEAVRYCGRLESYLTNSEYWAQASLMNRAELLLFLVDRDLIERRLAPRGYQYHAISEAEERLVQQAAMQPYLLLTLELLAAVRLASRSRCSKP